MIHYFKNIWSGVSTSFTGMMITFKHLFVKKVTIQYPNERFPLPDNARNRLLLDMSRCNGCTSCAIACPVNCITIETVRAVPDDPQKEFYSNNGKERKMWVTRYEMDFAKCCYCGLCMAACPSDAIVHTKEYEYSVYKRENLLYKFQTLTPDQTKEKKQMLADFQTKEKAMKAAEAKNEKSGTSDEKKE